MLHTNIFNSELQPNSIQTISLCLIAITLVVRRLVDPIKKVLGDAGA